MLKCTLLALVAALSLAAKAESTLSIAPQSVNIFTRDLLDREGNVVCAAPWIQVLSTIAADKELNVTGLLFEIVSAEGVSKSTREFFSSTYYISAGQIVTQEYLSVCRLPISNSNVYSVSVSVVGTLADQTTPINGISTSFKTE